MTLNDVYKKLDELEAKLDELKHFDYAAKDIINSGNYVTTREGEELTVEYSKNAKTIEGRTYSDLIDEIKNYIDPVMENLKTQLQEVNNKMGVQANFIKDWFPLKFDKSKEVDVVSLATLDKNPSFVSILLSLRGCSEKNGGSDGLIVQIPPIGVALDGIPFTLDDPDKLKNYSGWWFEDGELKMFTKKADFQKWLGKCLDVQCKIYAWY